MKFAKPIALAMLFLALGALVIIAGNGDGKAPATAAPSKGIDSAKGKEIEWLPFDKALVKAKTENKNILVDLTASWCGWCKKMEKETFSQPEVVDMVNKNFVPARVWGDSDNLLDIQGYKISERNLATSAFQVTGYPTFFFVCPDGKGLARFIGYRPKDAFLAELTDKLGKTCDTATVQPKQSTGAKPDSGK